MLVEEYNSMHKAGSRGPLEKYFKTKTLQRLKGKGLFCGMDFVGIPEMRPKYKYTRLDHSKTLKL
ncbi:MAG: hypothetical protein GX265_01575 [Mollicutes bacterium]|nr:hypothetical protein [Mollicutes bacterium]